MVVSVENRDYLPNYLVTASLWSTATSAKGTASMGRQSNMGTSDRVVRSMLGCSLIYLAFFNSALINDTLLNAAIGIFGVTNLISAIVGICPAYLLSNISSRLGYLQKLDPADNEPYVEAAAEEQSIDLALMRRKLLLSVSVPMFLILLLFAWTVFLQKHDSALLQMSQKQDAAALIAVQLTENNTNAISVETELSDTPPSESAIIQELIIDTDLFLLHDSKLNQIDTSFEKGIKQYDLIRALRDEIGPFSLLLENQQRGMITVNDTLYIWSTTRVGSREQWVTAAWVNPGEHVMTAHLLSSRFFVVVLVVIWMAIWSSMYIVRKFSDNVKDNAKKLYLRSMQDPLTRLPNRLKIDSIIASHSKNLQSHSECIALMMVDLIGFRDINDTMGHVISDELLTRVAHLLRELENNDVTVLRMSGDVFCLVCKTTQNRIEASRIANMIHDKLEHTHELGGVPIAVQVRIGISSYPIDSTDPQDLVRLADIALTQAKSQRVKDCFYQHEQDSHSVRKLTLLSRLRTAIEQDELTLVFQPKVNILDNSLAGVEVLVRWTDAEYGAVSPVEFVTWAEKSGLINKLTRWVMIAAEQQCREWRDRGYVIPFAVNLSPTNLHDKKLIPLVKRLVEKGSFGNGMLELELTENAVMEDPDKALATMKILKNMGVSFSIDDFGTGLSSFTYLRKFPVTNLKIDRAFVMDSDDSDRDAVLLQSMVSLGHSLGCIVTAEGVEDQISLDKLKSFKCNQVQGFHVCKPLQADQLIAWLAHSEWSVSRKVA